MESYKRMQKKAKEKMIHGKWKKVNENLVLGKVDAAYRAIKRNYHEDKPKSKNIRDEGDHIILDEFYYLESKITWDGRSKKEIKSRIAEAKMGFNSNQKLLCSSSISLENRKMLLETHVWSTAMYGCET